MISDHEFTRRMLRTVLTVVVAGIVIAALWAARDAIMLIYVSALIAMGFSPVVRLIERPKAFAHRRGVPRVLAILAVYLAIIAAFVLISMLIVPSLIEQATTLWDRLPQHFNDFQRILIKYKLTTHRISFQEAVQNAP